MPFLPSSKARHVTGQVELKYSFVVSFPVFHEVIIMSGTRLCFHVPGRRRMRLENLGISEFSFEIPLVSPLRTALRTLSTPVAIHFDFFFPRCVSVSGREGDHYPIQSVRHTRMYAACRLH